MRVIFLDIDGVLNNNKLLDKYGPDYIDPKKVELLKIIIYSTKSKIVLSSSWRLYDFSRKLVSIALEEKNMNFIDCTKNIPDKPRAEEIKSYISENKIDKFAILDDDPGAGLGLEDNFFKTDEEVGLTYEIVEKVINYFRRKHENFH